MLLDLVYSFLLRLVLQPGMLKGARCSPPIGKPQHLQLSYGGYMLATTLPPVLRDPMFPEISTFGDASDMWFSNFWWPSWTLSPKRESSGFRKWNTTSAISTAAGFCRFLSSTVSGLPEMRQGFGSPKCMRGMVLVSGSHRPGSFCWLLPLPHYQRQSIVCVWFLRCLFGSSWKKKANPVGRAEIPA